MQPQWTPEPNGYRCARHQVTFGRLETCPKCTTDPVSPEWGPEDEPIKPPLGCVSGADHEAALTSIALSAQETSADLMERVREEDSDKGIDWHICNLAKGWAELSIKARRAAIESCARREAEVIVARREKRLRQMKVGIGKGKN